MRLFNPTIKPLTNGLYIGKLDKDIEIKKRELSLLAEGLDSKSEQALKEYHDLMGRLDTKKAILMGEVSALENRRSKALESLDKQRNELSIKESELNTIESKLKNKENKIVVSLESLQEDKENFNEFMADKRSELLEREQSIKTKELYVYQVELQAKDSLDKANSVWIEYHKAIKLSNDQLLSKEMELEVREKGVAIDRESIQEANIQIANDRIAIQDGYASLARAKEEILGRKE